MTASKQGLAFRYYKMTFGVAKNAQYGPSGKFIGLFGARHKAVHMINEHNPEIVHSRHLKLAAALFTYVLLSRGPVLLVHPES